MNTQTTGVTEKLHTQATVEGQLRYYIALSKTTGELTEQQHSDFLKMLASYAKDSMAGKYAAPEACDYLDAEIRDLAETVHHLSWEAACELAVPGSTIIE